MCSTYVCENELLHNKIQNRIVYRIRTCINILKIEPSYIKQNNNNNNNNNINNYYYYWLMFEFVQLR